jgi:hypothetical protein
MAMATIWLEGQTERQMIGWEEADVLMDRRKDDGLTVLLRELVYQ